ncbi:MAG: LPXTG cell wall anchor domain-containing protein, partial [Clostridia bacterium]
GKTAKTGDEFPIGLIAGAALLALAGAGAVGFARRRKAN